MTTNQTIALAVAIAFVLLLVVQVVILFYVRSAPLGPTPNATRIACG